MKLKFFKHAYLDNEQHIITIDSEQMATIPQIGDYLYVDDGEIMYHVKHRCITQDSIDYDVDEVKLLED